jgi:cytochrome c biogenesis protein CcmG/thiol:disulfide interchange protein DsbE
MGMTRPKPNSASIMLKRALFFGSLAVFATSAGLAKQIWAKSFLGQQAPKLVVERWLTPAPKTEGKFVLVDFWATWCGPCRRAIPELNDLQGRFGDRLCVIGISNEPAATVRAMTSPKIEYSVAIDTGRRMYGELEIIGIPHILLIDPSGVVRWEGFPFLEGEELTPEVVGQIIEKYSRK